MPPAAPAGGPQGAGSGAITSMLHHQKSGPGATASDEPPAGGIFGKDPLELGGTGLDSLFEGKGPFLAELTGALGDPTIAASISKSTGKFHSHMLGNAGNAALKDTPLEAGLAGFGSPQFHGLGNIATARTGAMGSTPGFAQG